MGFLDWARQRIQSLGGITAADNCRGAAIRDELSAMNGNGCADVADVLLDPGQESALKDMLAGWNVYLSGDPGTGKSTVVKEFMTRKEGNCLAVLAPTGVAAINVDGSTIHRFFGFGIGQLEPDEVDSGSPPLGEGELSRRDSAVRHARVLVIDEVSMLRSDLMACVDARCRRLAATSEERARPFGGKQIILVGDFAQLPPVVRNEEKAYLQARFGGAFVFNTPSWREGDFRSHQLMFSHRHAGDQTLQGILRRVRAGDVSSLAAVNARLGLQPPAHAVYLCATNKVAEDTNTRNLANLPAKEEFLPAEITGRIRESDYPAPAELRLKEGARVVCLINEYAEKGTVFVNGDSGVVVGIENPGLPSACIRVRLDRDGSTAEVRRNAWSMKEYRYDASRNRMLAETVGTFVQFPLRLAWALTVHRSQGMTLPCVCLNLGGRCFAHGQLYVALSRARRLADIYLTTPLQPRDLILDPEVRRFTLH